MQLAERIDETEQNGGIDVVERILQQQTKYK